MNPIRKLDGKRIAGDIFSLLIGLIGAAIFYTIGVHGYLYHIEQQCIDGLYKFSGCSWEMDGARFIGAVSVFGIPLILIVIKHALQSIKKRYTT